MAKSKKIQPIKLPPAINPDGIRTVYSNNMETTASSLDVCLFFNHVIPSGQTVTVERRASVVMSFQHFAAVVAVLNDQFQKINKQVEQQKLLTSAQNK